MSASKPLHDSSLPAVQRVSAVLWPSFVLAVVAAGVFFTALDPVRLLECEGDAPMSPLGAYTLGFFGFWALGASCSLAAAYFLRPQR